LPDTAALTDALAAVDDWPLPRTCAVGVTDRDDVLAAHGAHDTVFPLASVTKPLAAYAVLVAVEQGRVDLDDDVDGEGRTVAHLLAHASGLGPEEGTPTSAPERRRVYSNLGYDLLGEHVEAAVRRPFGSWLLTAVLTPLGMHDTHLDGSPARDGHGTVADLLRFGRELLAPTLLDPELHERATTVAFPGLSGVLPGYGRQDDNDWGLGFEVRDHKDPHWTGSGHDPATFGHFGQSGSFLWVDPTRGRATAFLGDEPFGEWAVERWPGLNDAILAAL
jgi:CubicO group peptidase (beta-lactamase class C family)